MPLCLPRVGERYENLENCTIIGWGRTTLLGAVSYIIVYGNRNKQLYLFAVRSILFLCSCILVRFLSVFDFLLTRVTFQDSKRPYEGKVFIRPGRDCEEAYVGGTNNFTSSFVCAGSSFGEVNSCLGDSGGPLACRRPGETRKSLYGIVSFGNSCQPFLAPDSFTRITKYLRWIYGKIAGDR